ncbi:ribonuclease 3 [Clostridia bacterium]|nr:ribonuclease 3 [Clostridia bacterium]
MGNPLNELEAKLMYTFNDIRLLETAITHSSYLNENRGSYAKCYERLEFLGDAVLGMLTADMLYHTFGEMPEGELTRRRAMLVCEASLAAAAAKLDLGTYMRLGRGEDHSGGRARPSILADVLEAVLAAIYEDGGIDAARHFAVIKIFTALNQVAVTDYKSALQEKVQAGANLPITYQLIAEDGPDHEKRFTIEVRVGDKVMGEGVGSNKKEAEQLAAKDALKSI